jgi:hypothetical protein
MVRLLMMVLAASTVLATAPARSAYFGIGINSCANWLTPGKERDGRVWILGFFSGLSEMDPAGSEVGNETDAPAILAEVALICGKNPSMHLKDAVAQHYRSRGRK